MMHQSTTKQFAGFQLLMLRACQQLPADSRLPVPIFCSHLCLGPLLGCTRMIQMSGCLVKLTYIRKEALQQYDETHLLSLHPGELHLFGSPQISVLQQVLLILLSCPMVPPPAL